MDGRYRALVYIRKSQVRNRRDEISPERQLKNCLAAAEAHAWSVDEGDVYRDAEGHRSGRSEEQRPAWRALKARLTADPTVAAVVVNSLDRSSRSPKDFFNFLDLLEAHGVELVSVTEQFDTSTAIGRAFLAILMVIASLESDLASERMTATVSYLRNQGLHWGQTPFGYTRDDEAVPQPDENAAAAVTALELYAQGGLSCQVVADRMNHLGHRWRPRPDRIGPFKATSIRSLVTNVAVYAGWVPTLSPKEIRDAGPAESLEEFILLSDAVPGLHPALIDRELADRVLAARQDRTVTSLHDGDYIFLLTPLLVCADCGGQMVGRRDRRWRALPMYRHRGHTCSPGRGSCLADDIEEQVLALLDIPLLPEIIEDIKKGTAEQAATRPEGAELQRRLDARRSELERLRELYVLGDFAREEYLVRRNQTLATMREIEEQMGRPDYPLEQSVRRIERLGAILRGGNRRLQKRAIPTIFTSLSVGLDGQLARVELREWAQPLLADLARLAHHDPVGSDRVYCAPHIVALARIGNPLTLGGRAPSPLTQVPDKRNPARPG